MPIALLYHDVIPTGADDTSGFHGPGAARYKLTLGEFQHHLEAIQNVVRQRPVADTVSIARVGQPWLMTFDDGGSSSLSPIADWLEDRNWRGWFFMTTNQIDQPGFLTKSELRELARRGHMIGSHSCSHPQRMSYLPWQRLLDEWSRSVATLEDILGSPVSIASVPGGFYSHTVARAAAASGIQLLFNSEPTSGKSVVDGCQILGRYTIYRGMPARSAANLLAQRRSRWKQMMTWKAKKLAKKLGGVGYLAVREKILARLYPSSPRTPESLR